MGRPRGSTRVWVWVGRHIRARYQTDFPFFRLLLLLFFFRVIEMISSHVGAFFYGWERKMLLPLRKIRENDPVKFMKLEDWFAGAEKAFRMLSLMGRRKLRWLTGQYLPNGEILLGFSEEKSIFLMKHCENLHQMRLKSFFPTSIFREKRFDICQNKQNNMITYVFKLFRWNISFINHQTLKKVKRHHWALIERENRKSINLFSHLSWDIGKMKDRWTIFNIFVKNFDLTLKIQRSKLCLWWIIKHKILLDQLANP